MQSANSFDQNIQHLIQVNYQRMLAFEQAAFLSGDESLRTFYTARADESENNLKELYSYLNISEAEGESMAVQHTTAADTLVTMMFAGKKTAIKILQAANMFEKKILDWYKSTIKEIKSLPKEIVEVVSNQYKTLSDAQLQFQHL